MSTIVATSAGERNRVIGLLSVGHFYSHFSGLILPPVFTMLRQDFDVSYLALGSVMTAYAVTTSVGQIPVGFLVDKFGGRIVLLIGMALLSVSFGLVGVATEFWQIVVLAGLGGLGNSVFHPADYAILSARIQDSVLGRAMSVHAFSGYIGWALAPPFMIGIAALTDWRTAVIAAGVLGLAITAVMFLQGDDLRDRVGPSEAGARRGPPLAQGLTLMKSPPMMMMFGFFLLTAVTVTGASAFAIVGIDALYGTGEVLAGHALTGYMVTMAVGVLIGGWAADWTKRHNLLASLTITGSTVFMIVLGLGPEPPVVGFVSFAVAGLLMGVASPSRDLLVKAATPPGSIGVAFGFTSTGLGVGTGLGPIFCGWFMDAGEPGWMFVMLGAASALAVVTIVLTRFPDQDETA